jgi:succinoglycan biosynthesis protein ExoA
MISVSVIIPCRNEAEFIGRCLDSILTQDFPKKNFEILIVDGLSDDGTRQILEIYAQKYPCIRVLDNTKKIVSSAMNIGIKGAKGEIIVRMDVHTEYASDYITQCSNILREMKVENVGGPWVPNGKTYLQKAVSNAFQSPFSSGGAQSHNAYHEGLVDSVYLGCWNKNTLEKLGYFDEELVRNQDDELNLRIIRSGGRIWQSPKIKSWYYPRSSIVALFQQYSQYGYWKVRVIQKHKIPASIRHIVPGMFVCLIVILGMLSIFNNLSLRILVCLIFIYLTAILFASVLACKKPLKWKYIPIMPIMFFAHHFGYGCGFLCGILDFVVLKRQASKTFTILTRKRKDL